MFYCKKCLSPSTRPRLVFNDEGICNACSWSEEKKIIDWGQKYERFKKLLDRYRRKNEWDVIVPCSGGKDGSYVAWKLKNELGMHPLCVTFSPPMQTTIGRQNLENFRNSGFDLIEIRPNPEIYRRLCKKMFIDAARSKFPFVIGIGTAVSQLAQKFGIKLVIYGEEGETEYGGANRYKDKLFMNYKYYTKIYHEGHNIAKDYSDEFTEQELKWWEVLPKDEQKKIKVTWWSKFESWDDKLHADLAKEKCGLTTAEEQVGTFTNYAQIDDYLQDLHAFECFIKYGTGRATGDANLAIKCGRITREEGLNLVKEKDGIFPLAYLQNYLDYFKMTEEEFWAVIDKHANLEILNKTEDKNRPYILKEPIV